VTSAPLLDWIQANSAWLGYVVMILLGGVTAHILAFEKSTEDWPWWEHFFGLVASLIKATFVSIVVFFLAQQYSGWPPPLCFVLAGIGSVFASDTIRWGYDKTRGFFDARLPLDAHVTKRGADDGRRPPGRR
jgi:ABC-type Fe3+-siderophore transport system permease subunit